MIPIPIRNNILIKPIETEGKTKGGIILSEAHKVRKSIGLVVAVGNGTKDRPMEVKEGDYIFHVPGAGTEVQLSDDTYFIMDDACVHCIIPKE